MGSAQNRLSEINEVFSVIIVIDGSTLDAAKSAMKRLKLLDSSYIWICCDCNAANYSTAPCNSLLDSFNSPRYFSPIANLQQTETSTTYVNNQQTGTTSPLAFLQQAKTTPLRTYKPKDQATKQRKYPCGICNKTVTWKQKAIRCENSSCGKWYHTDCQNVCSIDHEHHLDNIWICPDCALPNQSARLFDLHLSQTTFENSSSMYNADGDSCNSSLLFLGSPLASSSPTQLQHNLQTPVLKGRPTRLLNINCQSILKNRESFATILDSTGCDIITGTETWLTDNIKDNEIFPQGYTIYRRDRETGQRGGGVFILINNDLISTRFQHAETKCEIVWARVEISSCKSLFIGSYYRPNAQDAESLAQLDESLARLPKNCHVWLAGDMNLPGIQWPSASIKPNCPTPAQHNIFIDILADHGLSQIVDQPTRGENTFDLIAVNNITLVNRSEVIPGISDHDAVFAEIDIRPQRYKQDKRRIPLYKKADWEKIETQLTITNQYIQDHVNSESTDSLWNKFKSDLHTAIDKHIPHKSCSSRNRSPWISAKIRKLLKKRKRLYRNSKQVRTENKESIKNKLRNLKHQIRKETRTAYWDYVETNIFPETSDEPNRSNKKLWSFIKHRKTDSVGVSPLKYKGMLWDKAKDKAEILNEQFKSVFSNPDELEPPSTNVDCQYPAIDDLTITTDGVRKLLENLNQNKSMGPDLIHPRVLKQLARVVAPILTVIFNKSLHSTEVPEDWKKANVAPIFKKGERYNAENYRPISLTCIASKIMEHILTKHIMKHLESNNILYKLQHGFRAKHSTETQLLTFVHDLYKNLRDNMQTDVIVMDFAKAFDKVPHKNLIHKLKEYGIGGYINQWIVSFLHQRQQRVVCEGEMSSWTPVTSGVPQGSVVGPILFLVYINDLPAKLQSKVRLFADDTIIYMSVTNEGDAVTLQKDLKLLEEWEAKSHMSFHPDKCNVLRVTRCRKPLVYDYVLHNQPLEGKDAVKYLGVIVHHKLSWNEHICNIVKKAISSIGFLRRNLQIHQKHIKSNAYKALVRPQIEYASTVWDPFTQENQNKIEMVQRRAARFVCNNYSREASVTVMLDELGWRSLKQRRTDQRLIMLYKIVNNLIEVDIVNELKPHSRHSRNVHSNSFRVPLERKTYLKYSFLPRTLEQWNALPAFLVTAPSLNAFKTGVCTLNTEQ